MMRSALNEQSGDGAGRVVDEDQAARGVKALACGPQRTRTEMRQKCIPYASAFRQTAGARPAQSAQEACEKPPDLPLTGAGRPSDWRKPCKTVTIRSQFP
ncbi:hypothetical protein JCM10599A_51570 [Paraburkholderia kururiensis]